MRTFVYDRSFEGLLTAVFHAYARREFPDFLAVEGEPGPLFVEERFRVVTDEVLAARVWRGLEQRAGKGVCNMVLCVWLSEEEGADMLLFRYLCRIFGSPHGVEYDFTDSAVLRMKQTACRVAKEGHRLMQFVRFQKAADGSYFAPVSPRYNALPLTVAHFRERFSDQCWLICDMRRGYGYGYDLHSLREVEFQPDGRLADGRLAASMAAEGEEVCGALWRIYYGALTIRERLNPKQQRRCMPVRYWKYMTEHW